MISSSSFLIPPWEILRASSYHFTFAPIRPFARFFHGWWPKMAAARQFCKVETLACFRTGFVRRSPTMKPVTRERASIVTGIINGPSLFSLIRASRRPCHASRASFVEKNNTQPPPPPRFRAFPITSSLIDTSLPPYTPGLTLSLPFLPFPPLLHTHIRTYKPPSSTASTRSPLCTPPCHSSISLCLHLSLPFDHQPRPLFLAHSLSFSRRRGTGTRYVILSMARRNMNASSVRSPFRPLSLVREEGSLSQHSAVIVITVMRISARALGCGGRSEGEWRRRRATPFDIDADESALPETSSEELVQNAATSERRS